MPFPIQAATLPNALAGRDVLGRGRTGSGKTLAFGLPVLARLEGSGPSPSSPSPWSWYRPGNWPRRSPTRSPRTPAPCMCASPPWSAVCRSAARPARCAPRGGRGRHARPPQGPDRPRRVPPRPCRRHRPRRSGPDGRHGLHAAGDRTARPGPGPWAAAAVLGHPGPQHRPPGAALPPRPGRALGRPVGRPRSPRWSTTCSRCGTPRSTTP